MGGSWSVVAGRFVRVVEGGDEPVERFDFVHRRPDVWAIGAPDSNARLVAAEGQVGLRHPDGWTARVPGVILTERVQFLLNFDASTQPVQLDRLGQEESCGRVVQRFRWRRTDRDLAGELLWDDDAGIVHRWANDDGRSERIDGLVIDGDTDDPAADPLLGNPPVEQRVGEVQIRLRYGSVQVWWSIDVPGVPSVRGHPPRLGNLPDAMDWARTHARDVTVEDGSSRRDVDGE